jgi:hypothetical protein
MPAAVPSHLRSATLLGLLAPAVLLGAACGEEIGDECTLSNDCSPRGDRVCDISSPGGYCTVIGCDFDTCPEESVCVRFFSVTASDRTCDPRAEDISEDSCTTDELCSLSGTCVPRTAEIRFCMLKCESGSDCREGYECRDEALMREHGGEPAQPPGQALPDSPQPFCAAEPF